MKRADVRTVCEALVGTGWLGYRNVEEAVNDVCNHLEKLDAEKPPILRAYQSMQMAANEHEALDAIVAFNKAYDKLPADEKKMWNERKKEWVKAFMSRMEKP